MTDEDAFLRKLLDNPADDVVRLVYADWLEERDEAAKAEFLRLEAEMPSSQLRRTRIKDRLSALAADLPPDWLAVVSDLPIEGCGQDRQRMLHNSAAARAYLDRTPVPPPPVFADPCPKKWQQLTATAEPTVRFCAACDESVYYCDTIVAARRHAAARQCLAVDRGIVRKVGDLRPPLPPLPARMTPEQAARLVVNRPAEELDPVSVKREAAKQLRIDPTSPGEPS